MSKKGNNISPDITAENLEKAIDKYQRPVVMRMLKGGALNDLDEEKRTELCHRLAALRSMEIIEFLSKDKKTFSADMLYLDFDVFQNRNFVNEVLDKYGKKFDVSDAEECKKLFSLACTVNNDKTVKTLIRQKKAVECYSLIGKASLPVFEQITLIADGQMNDDDRVQLYLNAFLSDEWEQKLIFMQDSKINYFLKNSEGKTAADLLEERIKSYKYPTGKKGNLQKLQEEQALKRLRKIQADEIREKKPLRKLILIAVICIAAAAVIGTVAGRAYVRNHASAESDDLSSEEEESSDDSSAEEETSTDDSSAEEETTTDDTTDETDSSSDDAATEETVSYSTDTSLVVADGDTVNIDYTGYIDDVAFDGGSTDGAGTDLVIGSGSYIDDFEDQLIGANVGDTVTVTVTFPEDYGVEDLNGQEAVFEVTINGIYE